MSHPYVPHEGTPLWQAVSTALADLTANGDLTLTTEPAYAVGLLCHRLSETALVRPLPEPVTAVREYQLVFEDDPGKADDAAVEVRVVLSDGTQRWCFFMTPAALGSAGDWVPGTKIPMHWGETHMFVVAACSAEIIRSVLDLVDLRGELLQRTRPC